jgi:hypothetical protein
MKARLIPLLALCILVGCSKIHEERSFTVEAGGSHSLQITAPLSEQTVKVVMNSEEPVNVYVLLDKNVPDGKDEFDPEGMKEGVLAKEKGKKDATLTATIPAKEKYRVYVNGVAKKTNVIVKVDSQ